MSGVRVAWAIVRKDLLLELRTRERLGHMAVFAALVVALLSVALPASEVARRAWAPALLWVVLLLTSLLGLARSFAAESEDGAIGLLARVPCDRGWIFAGKAAANAIALAGLTLWTALLFAVLLAVDWSGALLPLAGCALLGSIGLAAVGTLLAGMSLSVRLREFLLPLLLFPLVLPVLVISAQITTAALDASAISPQWWGALALYDWVFVLIGYFVFDFVLED